MERYELLDEAVVEDIKAFLNKKRSERNISAFFPNVILRSDVLQILDNECTVVYYPLENEGNNGFHISGLRGRDGQDFIFVFINTHQTLEKQIFTAAHELGHAWKIEEYISNKQGRQLDESYKERIVNRFAAELLMPENEFREQFNTLKEKYSTDNRIAIKDFLKLTAVLMNFFLVPMKAIMARMAEIGAISVDTINKFISKEDGKLADLINQTISRIVKEEGFTDLYKPTDKKLIDGLAELLEEAEDRHTVSQEKIDNMRIKFGLIIDNAERIPEQDIMLESEKTDGKDSING